MPLISALARGAVTGLGKHPHPGAALPAARPAAAALPITAAFTAPVLLPASVSYCADGSGRFELRGSPDRSRLHVSGAVTRG